jgi:MFS family permease
LRSELSAGTEGIQWFLSAYSLTFGLGLVPAGRLGDVHGRKRLFILGLVVFCLGAVASSLAPDVWFAVVGRLVQGLGAGLVSAQVLGMIQDEFHGGARVRALAGYSMAGAAAVIVGPLLCGALLASSPAGLGWRLVLLLSVPILATSALLATRLPASPPPHRDRADLDVAGIAALGAIVVLGTLPVIDHGLTARAVVVVVSTVALLAVVLARWENRYARRGRVPLFAPLLMRSTGFVVGNVVALLWFGSVVAQSTVVTLFLLQARDLPALTVAAVLIPSALARIVLSWWSSRLYGRFGPVTIVLSLAGQTLTMVAVLAATALSDTRRFLLAVIVIEVFAGATSGLIEPPLRALTLGFAPSDYRGLAASFLQLSQRLSATFCVALMTGLLFSSPRGAESSAQGLRAAVAVCALLTAVATVVARHPALRHPGLSRQPDS